MMFSFGRKGGLVIGSDNFDVTGQPGWQFCIFPGNRFAWQTLIWKRNVSLTVGFLWVGVSFVKVNAG